MWKVFAEDGNLQRVYTKENMVMSDKRKSLTQAIQRIAEEIVREREQKTAGNKEVNEQIKITFKDVLSEPKSSQSS